MSQTYEFSIIVSGVDTASNDFEDRFFEAGCDDATIVLQKGFLLLEFDREAASFRHAFQSAIADVLKTGVEIERFEPDHLVSASEIARRSGLTRAAISHYAMERRGERFPHAVARVSSDSPLWDWVEVAEWMRAHGNSVSEDEIVRAKWLRAANNVINKQRHSDKKIEPRLEKALAVA
jgi:predicted DNA-binding transcriptional regulator AlpA